VKILLAIATAVLLLFGVARWSDGPLGIVAGGPLTSGPLLASQGVDFSFASDLDTIEFQLMDPPRSRTTWVIFHEGALFVPAGFMDLPIWKQWPHEASKDGRAIVRIEGTRYPVELERVEDRKTWQRVGLLAARKYNLETADFGADPSAEDWERFWVFKLSPRPID
jgi:hypothetical protein